MDLGEIRQRLSGVRSRHSKSVSRASKFVKGVLIVGGACAAGVAQFITWPDGGSPAPANIVGIAASFAVLIGGLYVLWTETDAADAIEAAEKATDAAQEIEASHSDIADLFEDFDRLVQTYQIGLTMRGGIEQAAIGSVGSIDTLVSGMFDLVSRQLAIAAGFAQRDRWTIGIYKAVIGTDGRAVLTCIAQRRAIECATSDARDWPEGVGIGGIAYVNAREIVVPDLRAEGVQAVFGPRGMTRPYDSERYVSMVSVPIMVAGREKPWGVVNATSDSPGHFAAESRPGFKTDEPIRTLASFCALAVAMHDAQERARGGTLDASARPVSDSSTSE